jgi:hypothetical protein
MTTKAGITLLVVGGYTMALGLAGINANSGGAQWLFSIIFVIGMVLAGWAVLLPWKGSKERAAVRYTDGDGHRQPPTGLQ